MGKPKIGIEGTTADPFTTGHLAIADAALTWGLDKVIIIVTNVPPSKGLPLAPADFRNQMTKAAVRAHGDGRIEVWDLEINRGGVSLMVDTLQELREKHNIVEPWLIIGADNDPKSWREPRRLAQYAPRLLVAPRPGKQLEDQGPYWDKDHVDLLPGPILDVSSSMVKLLRAAGKPVDHLVAPGAREMLEASPHYPVGVQNFLEESDYWDNQPQD